MVGFTGVVLPPNTLLRLDSVEKPVENANLGVFEQSLDPSSLIFHDDEESMYAFLFKKGIEAVVFQVATKTLQHRDLTILMIYIIHASWRNGRCRLTTARVAEMMGHKIETIYPSVKRLKKARLLVPIKDSKTGEKLHLINPFLLKAGSGRVRGAMIKAFNDALQSNGNPVLTTNEDFDG